MRINILALLSMALLTLTSVNIVSDINKLTPLEKEEGWTLLFNGKTLEGWRGYNMKKIPDNWTISENTLKVGGQGTGEAGDIIFNKKFKNFDLKFEWKVSKGANSGVLYLGQEVQGLPFYMSANEYQVLDNISYPGNGEKRASASLYDMIAASPQNAKPALEWNTGEIIVKDGVVIHKQNGVVVVKFQLWNEDWSKMIHTSKFKDSPYLLNLGGEMRNGFIGLQSHIGKEKDDFVWFKNIKLREL